MKEPFRVEPGIDIELPRTLGGTIQYIPSTGKPWESPREAAQLADKHQSSTLLQLLRTYPEQRDELLRKAGNAIGNWLLDDDAQALLFAHEEESQNLRNEYENGRRQ